MPKPSFAPPDSAVLVPVRVWDLPTRVFHWLLASCVVGSVVSAKIGGNAMDLHLKLGCAVLALLAFRLVWGAVGGYWSRFASFAFSPATVLRYLRGGRRPGESLDVGHNPLGSLSVIALLGLLAVQVGTGLVADDEIASVGPLNRFVSNATATRATGWHHATGQWLLIALVGLHVAAILFYRLKKKVDLVGPMFSGDKPLPQQTPASADTGRTRLLALLLGTGCAGLGWWISRLGG